jgi:Flp pilus assembly protein TadG
MRKRRRGTVLVLFTLMLPTLLMPLVGLAIDASICRLSQARLQAAVDGAALGAGRLLGTTADPETVAREFIDANFRTDNSAGSWAAYNLDKTDVHYTPGITKRIDINASANIPLLFMRILGKTTATISAAGSATRSDSRVVFVLDRSPSMNAVLATVKSQAQGFVNGFTSSADELGLVVLDSSSFVAYPPSNPNWDSTITATSRGGPSAAFADPHDANNMINQIGAITTSSGGYTGTSDAISVAYMELQKTHLRDEAADPGGKDYRLNSIVLLTDGLPQSVSVWPNNPADPENPPTIKDQLRSGTGCTNKTPATWVVGNAAPPPIMGFVGISRPFTSNNNTSVLYQLSSTDTTHNTTYLLTHDSLLIAPNPNNGGGCRTTFNGSPAVVSGTNSDFGNIPHYDRYGNSLDGTAYMAASEFVDANDNVITNQLPAGVTYDRTHATASDAGTHWALASWNAADSAARRIRDDWNKVNRTGDLNAMPIYIYVIGYTGNGGVDRGLLRRIANDPKANNFDRTKPIGAYYSAGDAAQLSSAFNTVLTAILRLAK